MEKLAEICGWDTATYFIFSENVFGKLVYYSHILPLLISLTLSLFVFVNNKKSMAGRLLLFISVAFSLWSTFDLILWATEKPYYSIFFWSLLIYLEPLIYAGTFYLLYILINGYDLKYKYKLIYSLLFLPIILLGPTSLNLVGYDFTNCDREAIEGPLWLYTYLVELTFVVSIIIVGLRSILKRNQTFVKIFLSTAGSLLFLLSFSWGNITGSLAVDWELGQYGLFGLPIFIGILAYLIVRYKEFNVKLISAQAITALLWIILFSILFIRTIENVRVIVSLTLMVVLIFGLLLVRSVKKEIEQREKIELLAKDLEGANNKLKELDQLKSEFLSLATHQIRAPLTAIKGYSSMLLEGDFGVLPKKAQDSVNIIMASCQNLINIVGDFLDISRIEQGRMSYEKETFEMTDLILEVTDSIKPNILNAGLKLKLDIGNNISAKVTGDRNKIKQIIGNLVDNAIKYTLEGSITISLSTNQSSVMVDIIDTGVGIEPGEIDKLFNKFSRTKDANKTNVIGTGLGLYIAKKMAEAHQGDIKVESGGLGKGSKFTIILPKAA